MRPSEAAEASRLYARFDEYERSVGSLPGIRSPSSRNSFVEQILESERRSRYVNVILSRDLGPGSGDPATAVFDPLKAAIVRSREGDREEAFWMLFLFAHFGKNRRGGYRYARDVYGRLGQGGRWDWRSVRRDVYGFRTWLDAHAQAIKDAPEPGGFGNHRKYESLAGWSASGTGAVVASYVEWIESARSHDELVQLAFSKANEDPEVAFDILYRSMASVHRFGRTARFDYLSMAGKINLAPIRPGKCYITSATGPRRGTGLLFGTSLGLVNSREMERRLRVLEDFIDVGFDTLEDALCNWQKSPEVFMPFRG